MKKDIYLVFHSHFYQPPREDPWCNEIEIQKGTSPYKNWNEKITAECYIPNSKAKVVNSKNKLINIVNNYKYYNFNFGPTLLNWLKVRYKLLYKLILDGDTRSKKTNNGFGNAIAQVYNHIILPLADYEDKKTQIIWGIEDFKNNFNREPASIWLAETAINYDTVDVLVEFKNFKYIILSPFQADKIKKIGGKKWQDVNNGSIDTKQPYRLYSKKYPEKYINVFFYDGDLSHKISFENLLTNAGLLYNAIKSKIYTNSKKPQIISVATDGETYGHHHKFGELAIGYLVEELLAYEDIQITNFENYLNLYPPEYEVAIKSGEGSAWSCSHGVGRWYRDCGCKINLNRNWNQKWRTPLRNGLNIVRDNLRKIYIAQTEKYFKNSMAARNDYIKILIDNSKVNIETFFSKHLKNRIDDNEKNKLIKLLEIQKYSMYMFTSCAWFFDDITDVATIQILKYAAWAIFLNKDFEISDIENLLLNELEKAESNIPKFKNGKNIYLTMVKPEILTFKKIINFIIIAKHFKVDTVNIPNIYEYNIYNEKNNKDNSIYTADILIKNRNTMEAKEYKVISVQNEALNFRNIIINKNNSLEINILKQLPDIQSEHFINTFNNLTKNKNLIKKIYGFNDLRKKDAKQIIELFINKEENNIIKKNRDFFEKYNQYIHFLTAEDINIDIRFKMLMRDYFDYYLKNFLSQEITFDEIYSNKKICNLLSYTKNYNIEINNSRIKSIIKKDIDNIKNSILKHSYSSDIYKLNQIFSFCKKMEYKDIIDYLQEESFYLLNKVIIKRIYNLIGKIKFEVKDGILNDNFSLNEYKVIKMFLELAKELNIETTKYQIYMEKIAETIQQ